MRGGRRCEKSHADVSYHPTRYTRYPLFVVPRNALNGFATGANIDPAAWQAIARGAYPAMRTLRGDRFNPFSSPTVLPREVIEACRYRIVSQSGGRCRVVAPGGKRVPGRMYRIQAESLVQSLNHRALESASERFWTSQGGLSLLRRALDARKL